MFLRLPAVFSLATLLLGISSATIRACAAAEASGTFSCIGARCLLDTDDPEESPASSPSSAADEDTPLLSDWPGQVNNILAGLNFTEQVKNGLYNYGWDTTLQFTWAIRFVSIVGPLIQIALTWVFTRYLRARRAGAILRGESFCMHGGIASVAQELWEYSAAHSEKGASSEGEAQRDGAGSGLSGWLKLKCGLLCRLLKCCLFDERARGLMLLGALSFALKYTQSALESFGEWQPTVCVVEDQIKVLNDTMGNAAEYDDSWNKTRVPLIWAVGEDVGMNYTVDLQDIFSDNGQPFHGFSEDSNRTLSLAISQCLAKNVSSSDSERLLDCLTVPGNTNVAVHNVAVSGDEFWSQGSQDRLAEARMCVRAEDEDNFVESCTLPARTFRSPFSQTQYLLQYEDPELNEELIDCTSLHEFKSVWLCMTYDAGDDSIVLMDVTNAYRTNPDDELKSIPALRFKGVGKIQNQSWKLLMLARLSQINAGGYIVTNTFDALAMSIVLARADYLQRDFVDLCAVPQEKLLVISYVWLLAAGLIALLAVWGLLYSSCSRKPPFHLPNSNWDWYLEGARASSSMHEKQGVDSSRSQVLGAGDTHDAHAPVVKYDLEFGLKPANEGVHELGWVEKPCKCGVKKDGTPFKIRRVGSVETDMDKAGEV